MTAIGFAMFWIGSGAAMWLRDWESPLHAQSDRFMIAIIFSLSGFISVLSGIAIWLWKVMP